MRSEQKDKDMSDTRRENKGLKLTNTALRAELAAAQATNKELNKLLIEALAKLDAIDPNGDFDPDMDNTDDYIDNGPSLEEQVEEGTEASDAEYRADQAHQHWEDDNYEDQWED